MGFKKLNLIILLILLFTLLCACDGTQPKTQTNEASATPPEEQASATPAPASEAPVPSSPNETKNSNFIDASEKVNPLQIIKNDSASFVIRRLCVLPDKLPVYKLKIIPLKIKATDWAKTFLQEPYRIEEPGEKVIYTYRISNDKSYKIIKEESILTRYLIKETGFDSDYLCFQDNGGIIGFRYNENGALSHTNDEVIGLLQELFSDPHLDTYLAEADSLQSGKIHHIEGVPVDHCEVYIDPNGYVNLHWIVYEQGDALDIINCEAALQSAADALFKAFHDQEEPLDILSMHLTYSHAFDDKSPKYLDPVWVVTLSGNQEILVHSENKKVLLPELN